MTLPTQPTLRPCLECGGQRVRMPGFELAIGKRGFIGIQLLSQLDAVVCLNCGYTSLYAGDLPAVQEEVRKQPQKYQF